MRLLQGIPANAIEFKQIGNWTLARCHLDAYVVARGFCVE